MMTFLRQRLYQAAELPGDRAGTVRGVYAGESRRVAVQIYPEGIAVRSEGNEKATSLSE